MNVRPILLTGVLSLMLVGCADDGKSGDAGTSGNGDGDGDGSSGAETMTTSQGDGDTGDGDSGDGDGDTGDGDGDTGDGDGDTGDGDGDTGDGDGDTGDGDGDTGDGDGDTGDGDGDTGGDGDGDSCSGQGASCANGEACCGNLTCCIGLPVPMGQEFCSGACPISDKNQKFGFQTIEPQWVLDQVVDMPISTWSYKSGKDGYARHIGPMAQDFEAAFHVGESDKFIFQVDADGVSFAAIQALDAKVDELETENAQLRATLKQLEARLDKLEK